MLGAHNQETRLSWRSISTYGSSGEVAVREIQEASQHPKRPSYTTVQTVLTRIEERSSSPHVDMRSLNLATNTSVTPP